MNFDGADARHLIGASGREEKPLRPLDGGASTQRWVHTLARGSRRRLGRAPSARARRSTESLDCSLRRVSGSEEKQNEG
jgi:hypothetical protein